MFDDSQGVLLDENLHDTLWDRSLVLASKRSIQIRVHEHVIQGGSRAADADRSYCFVAVEDLVADRALKRQGKVNADARPIFGIVPEDVEK